MPLLKPNKIDGLIEEYHFLKDRIKNTETRCKEIEQELLGHMEEAGVRKLQAVSGPTVYYTDIEPLYGVDEGAWEYIIDKGVEHEKVCVGKIDADKLVPLVEAGILDRDTIFQHIKETRKGYKRFGKGNS